jgi:hypothetical protein
VQIPYSVRPVMCRRVQITFLAFLLKIPTDFITYQFIITTVIYIKITGILNKIICTKGYMVRKDTVSHICSEAQHDRKPNS